MNKTKKHTLNWQPKNPDPELKYLIIFDGEKTNFFYDSEALLVSSEKEGIYPIVICQCYHIGCAGMYVSVKHTNEDIIWEKFWDGFSCGEPEDDSILTSFDLTESNNKILKKSLIVTPPLVFNKGQYTKIAKEIDTYISKTIDEKSKKWREKTIKDYKAGNTFHP